MWRVRAAKPRPSSSTCLQLVYRVSLFYALCNVFASLLDLLSAALTFAFYLSLPTCISLSFWERSVFLLWRPSLFVCDHVWQEEQCFQSNGACKRNLWPRCVGTCRCVIESRYVLNPSLFFVPFVYTAVEECYLEKRKKKRGYENVSSENRNFILLPFCLEMYFHCTSLNYQCLWFLPTLCDLTPAVPWSGSSRVKGSLAHGHRL